MKNKFKIFIFILIYSIFSFKNLYANEPFIFDITEMEILDNGNKINGYKGGTATSEDGSTITGENFFFDKLTNILEINGNVKYSDKIKNIIITADKAIYLKNNEKVLTIGNSKALGESNTITANNLEYDKILNIFKAKKDAIINDFENDTTIYADEITYLKGEEKVFTIGKTKAFIQKKYKFNSQNVSFLRNTQDIFSQKKSSMEDDNGNIYKLDNFTYNINKELLKGKNINVLAKVDEKKFDQYFFSEGFFNLKDQSHLAKETKILAHKDIFDDENNDPRLYGSTSISNQEKMIIKNGTFTSCKLDDDCPPWSIKAEEIIHDKIRKNMIYKNAILKVYDVPVLYFPKFFHPDPSVKRRSGFLQPQFNNSETLGSSLFLPYFKTLGNDKDLTIKPTFFEKITKFEKEKYILQSEFRKKNKDSSVIADFGFLRDYKSSADNKTKNVNHLFLNYENNLNITNYSNSELKIQVEKVTNDTYLKVFQNNLFDTPVMPDNQTTMNSYAKFYLDKDDQNFGAGFTVYENLGTKQSDRYQYTLPYINYSKNLSSIAGKDSGGSLNFTTNGTNTLSNTNNLRTTISNSINYVSQDFISSYGFKNNFNLYFSNSNSIGKNDSTYTSNVQIDGKSILKFDTSFPLSKSTIEQNESLIPKVSFRINPGNNVSDNSGSSSIINTNNVFDIGRLGIGEYEAGKSLTFGLDYNIDRIESGKYLELKLATVIRDQNEPDIPSSSTINRKNSNLFGSINSNLLNNIDVTYDFSLDNDLKTINSNSIETEISINNFVTSFDFIEQRNEIGSTHLLSNVTKYRVDDKRSLIFSTRRNKEINLTEYYNLSYEYKNDCLTAALRFNKTFYEDNDLVPTEDLFFSITLIPLTTYERAIYKKTPGQSGLKEWFN
jgi:LPS-assembly protein